MSMAVKDDGDSMEAVEAERFHTHYRKLTQMQRSYVDNRLQGLNPQAAAKAAGYASEATQGYQLERNPTIKSVLTMASQQVLRRMTLTRADVLAGLQDAVNTAATATELVAAWREIGKILGVYEPERVEHIHKLEDMTREKLTSMSDAELLKHAGEADFRLTDDDVIEAEYEELSDYVPDDIEPQPIEYENDG